jgi:hypothetical protein
MYRHRTHYWSCSEFANWVRGTSKPSAETAEGWAAWRNAAKSAHSFRYWIAEEGLDKIQDIVYYPYDVYNNVLSYINNRYVARTYQLTSKLKRGEYYDLDTRMLHCLFDELVTFVEVEKANMQCLWNKESQEKFNYPSRAVRRLFGWRCAAAGVEYLNWEASLKYDDEYTDKNSPDYGAPTPQALTAKEVLELYNWWTVVRPARPDPMEVSGWTAYCAESRVGEDREDWLSSTSRNKPERDNMLQEMNALEAKYEAEDEEMLIRLIKIRKSLWT